MVGDYYRWYEAPFIGLNVSTFYITIVVIATTALAVLGSPCLVALAIAVIAMFGVLACGLCGLCACCCKPSKKSKKPKKSVRRGRGSPSKRGEIQTFSPPGGKGRGPPPKKLGVRATSPRQANSSIGKGSSINK